MTARPAPCALRPVRAPPRARSAPCAVLNAGIFWIYAPGLILYVLKKPQSQTFGFHEIFHTSVLAGHVASMALDLRDIALPCARGFCS